jgi:hypothetical protein
MGLASYGRRSRERTIRVFEAPVSVDVQVQVQVYEDDKSETWGDSSRRIIVESHWNDRDAVVIEVDGKRYTVMANHVRDALDAATVSRR